jgi:hypothetical protein
VAELTELQDLQHGGPEEDTPFEPWMVQQLISWKRGYPESGGAFTLLNENDDVALAWIEGDGLYATPDDGTTAPGRVLVDEYHGFVGQIVMTSVDPATLPLTWQVCDGTAGTPDLRRKFVLGVSPTNLVDTTGGAETTDISNHNHAMTHNHGHSHTAGLLLGPLHSHGAGSYSGPSHSHTGPSHDHGGPSHQHTGPSHDHAAGTYSGPSHQHTGPSHTHSGSDLSISGSLSGPSTLDGLGNGGGTSVPSTTHTHALNTLDVSGNTAAEGTGNTGLAGTGLVTGTSATGGTGTTGLEGTGLTTATGTGLGGLAGTGLVTGTSDNGGNGSVSGSTASDSTGASNSTTTDSGAATVTVLNPYHSLYYVARVA